MKVTHVVSAIIRREDHILMVKQPDEDGLYWFIPGGVIEPGEMIAEALGREVREETGLTIADDARLAFVTQVNTIYENRQTVAFVFDVSAHSGELMPDDPDQLTHDVAFVLTGEALQRLARVTWPQMRDPLVAYLSGASPAGCVWQFRQHSPRTFELVYRTVAGR
ncbi:MAG: NUDIX hydrolase [Anaerolineae bacterium]|nr:NUDIX hydrolase [Anaerolineae bacterium]